MLKIGKKNIDFDSWNKAYHNIKDQNVKVIDMIQKMALNTNFNNIGRA